MADPLPAGLISVAVERARRFVQRYVHSEERQRFEDGHDDALINMLMPEFAEAEHEAALWREAAKVLADAHFTAYARAEALALELRRLHDGQPDGHQRPRPLGLVSDEPLTGD